ncbi:MAG: hypothetical protein LBS85_05660 [Clostridiales Family XIII bacterium]|nr:hypothetical protein [Clostridiales Family XIII bacterium]
MALVLIPLAALPLGGFGAAKLLMDGTDGAYAVAFSYYPEAGADPEPVPDGYWFYPSAVFRLDANWTINHPAEQGDSFDIPISFSVPVKFDRLLAGDFNISVTNADGSVTDYPDTMHADVMNTDETTPITTAGTDFLVRFTINTDALSDANNISGNWYVTFNISASEGSDDFTWDIGVTKGTGHIIPPGGGGDPGVGTGAYIPDHVKKTTSGYDSEKRLAEWLVSINGKRMNITGDVTIIDRFATPGQSVEPLHDRYWGKVYVAGDTRYAPIDTAANPLYADWQDWPLLPPDPLTGKFGGSGIADPKYAYFQMYYVDWAQAHRLLHQVAVDIQQYIAGYDADGIPYSNSPTINEIIHYLYNAEDGEFLPSYEEWTARTAEWQAAHPGEAVIHKSVRELVVGFLWWGTMTPGNTAAALGPYAPLLSGFLTPVSAADIKKAEVTAEGFELVLSQEAVSGKEVLLTYYSHLDDPSQSAIQNQVTVTGSFGAVDSNVLLYNHAMGGGASGDANAITVVKQDENGEPLAGASFNISIIDRGGGARDGQKKHNENLMTNAEGAVTSTDLGSYTKLDDIIITELAAPGGYDTPVNADGSPASVTIHLDPADGYRLVGEPLVSDGFESLLSSGAEDYITSSANGNIHISVTNRVAAIDPIIGCEVDKDTIRRTSAAYESLPGHEDFSNVGAESERYRYDIDFRSTSNVDSTEFAVDDPLENVRLNQVRLEELWTPVVWGDVDGLFNVWYKTNKTDSRYAGYAPHAPTAAETPYLNADGVFPNTGYALWPIRDENGVPQTGPADAEKRYHLYTADLNLAADEYVTAVRLQYDAVEPGFTSKNTETISLNGEHRDPLTGEIILDSDNAGAIDLLSAVSAVSALSGDEVRPFETGITENGVDWRPKEGRPDYRAELASVTGLKPASYLVSAVRAMSNEDIVSSAAAGIALGTMQSRDQDAVVTREVVTFTAGSDDEGTEGTISEESFPTENTEETEYTVRRGGNAIEQQYESVGNAVAATGDRTPLPLLWLLFTFSLAALLALINRVGKAGKKSAMKKGFHWMFLLAFVCVMVLSPGSPAFAAQTDPPSAGDEEESVNITMEYHYAEGEEPDIPGSLTELGIEYRLISLTTPVLESELPRTRTYRFRIDGAVSAEDIAAFPGLADAQLTPVEVYAERRVDKQEVIEGLDNNDVDALPLTKEYQVANAASADGFTNEELARAAVRYDVTADDDGLPTEYRATIIYRGTEVLAETAYYLAELAYTTTLVEGQTPLYVVVAVYEPVLPAAPAAGGTAAAGAGIGVGGGAGAAAGAAGGGAPAAPAAEEETEIGDEPVALAPEPEPSGDSSDGTENIADGETPKDNTPAQDTGRNIAPILILIAAILIILICAFLLIRGFLARKRRAAASEKGDSKEGDL